MAKIKFEENLASPTSFRMLKCTAAILSEAFDPESDDDWAGNAANPSNSIIQTDQEITFNFKWGCAGILVQSLCGTWNVQVYLEQMGENEFGLPGARVDIPFEPVSGHQYDVNIVVRPNVIPAGLYRAVAAITLVSEHGKPLPVAGFADFGLLQFYTA